MGNEALVSPLSKDGGGVRERIELSHGIRLHLGFCSSDLGAGWCHGYLPWANPGRRPLEKIKKEHQACTPPPHPGLWPYSRRQEQHRARLTSAKQCGRVVVGPRVIEANKYLLSIYCVHFTLYGAFQKPKERFQPRLTGEQG